MIEQSPSRGQTQSSPGKKKQCPVYPEENSCLRCSTPNIRAQTILDVIFESDDEEDVQVSKRRRIYQDQILKKVVKTMG